MQLTAEFQTVELTHGQIIRLRPYFAPSHIQTLINMGQQTTPRQSTFDGQYEVLVPLRNGSDKFVRGLLVAPSKIMVTTEHYMVPAGVIYYGLPSY